MPALAADRSRAVITMVSCRRPRGAMVRHYAAPFITDPRRCVQTGPCRSRLRWYSAWISSRECPRNLYRNLDLPPSSVGETGIIGEEGHPGATGGKHPARHWAASCCPAYGGRHGRRKRRFFVNTPRNAM